MGSRDLGSCPQRARDRQLSAGSRKWFFAAISKDRNCHYCTAAHLACCRSLGVDPAFLNSLVRAYSLNDVKVRDMLLFGLKCFRDPKVYPNRYACWRHGLGHPEILELIAMSGLAVYANIMADATGMEADSPFASLA